MKIIVKIMYMVFGLLHVFKDHVNIMYIFLFELVNVRQDAVNSEDVT